MVMAKPRAALFRADFATLPGAAQFSCTKLKSGVAYLDADFTIVCYDKVHLRYVGGAIIWLFLVPLGVPAFFIWLLVRALVMDIADS